MLSSLSIRVRAGFGGLVRFWKMNLKPKLMFWMFVVVLGASGVFAMVLSVFNISNDLLGTFLSLAIFAVILLIVMAFFGLRVSKGKGVIV